MEEDKFEPQKTENQQESEDMHHKPPRLSLINRIGAIYYWVAILHMLFYVIIEMMITLPIRFIQRTVLHSKTQFQGYLFTVMRFWMGLGFRLIAIDYRMVRPVS